MLYTGKGDDGTTYAFGSSARFTKDSSLAEALGTLDEINALLGLVKTEVGAWTELVALLADVQNDLFIIQSEVAGADKHLEPSAITKIETIVNDIEKTLPPINSFFVAGGTHIAAQLDVARTVARRTERRIVASHNKNTIRITPLTLAYLNRLSSLLYALSREANRRSDITEVNPTY